MTMNDKVLKSFNRQINAELFSSYLYLSIAAYFESLNLRGFAKWMQLQAQEEINHAMKFYGHIVDRNGRVSLNAIEEPKKEWKSPYEAAMDAYNHEQKITKMIHDLVKLTGDENDYEGNNMLQWFVDEQIEEEQQTRDMVKKLEYIGESKSALIMLDKHFGKRKDEKD
jgi:ferritin